LTVLNPFSQISLVWWIELDTHYKQALFVLESLSASLNYRKLYLNIFNMVLGRKTLTKDYYTQL